ncbi:sugar ABC transporter substrate-binding protein [Streptomyces tubbatahanensis]|uniref:Sugar ABC transporter substrate-binding protein n=1 Tax=Streptomyces tubbatahanensis TaxID=2923272 RepID=A0ABY3XPZ5_9ACTN|nr:sugar ABC transporter substrate-binding protein [Streptomyces tubbatahanensis]UNS96485.1 sugar ABC transporter substrate-binding protein [Streptomyces tubbatahanensis]
MRYAPRGTRGAVRAATATLLACALLTSCAGGGEGDGEGTVTLDYYSLAWQKESVAANKKLVARWNKTHHKVKVRYVQGAWDTVHDQLLTSFEGGEAPDVIHDDASDLTDFAYGGYLADLRDYLPKEARAAIPQAGWDSVTMNGGRVYGVPFLQEPKVIIADKKLLERSGVRIPTAGHPWTWQEFERAAKKLTRDKDGNGTPERYGTVWPMKEPVKQSVNLSLSTGGRLFTRERTGDGTKNTVRFAGRDAAISELIHRQVNKDRTAPRSGLGMGGSDTLPGFFAGRYAMVPLNFSFRQQVQQQAPDGFEWTVLPLPRGQREGENAQGVVPQTLSVAQESAHKKAAADFVAYMTTPEHQAVLAKGDWLLPTAKEALKDPEINRREDGWRTGARIARTLRPSPTLGVRGYAEWSDKVATPAFQRYYRADTDLDALRDALVDDGNLILDRYQR